MDKARDDNARETGPLPPSIDPYAPSEIAARVETAAVKRAHASVVSVVLLAVLGGAYIGFGGALATCASTGMGADFGLGRLAVGLAFSLGAVLLVICGGELFTGNSLMILAGASRKITWSDIFRNWSLVFPGNALGALAIAIAIHSCGALDGAAVKAAAIRTAEAKAHLSFSSAFMRGVLCNMLVCLAVWLSIGARSLEGKIIAIMLPIAAFVALGFEHCIANFYLIPVGAMSGADVSVAAFVSNIAAVTAGNVLGGLIIAMAYYGAYVASVPDAVLKSAVQPLIPRALIEADVIEPDKEVWAAAAQRGDDTKPMFAMPAPEARAA